jgi:serine/threonine protein kinase
MVEPSDSRFAEMPLAAKKRIDSICAQFEAAWRTGRPDPADYCGGGSDAEQAALLSELLFIDIECRRRQGDIPVVGDYLDRFAGHEELIREVFLEIAADPPTRADLHQAQRTAQSAGAGGAAPRRPPNVPGYEVLEELGRGGMGVVYRARHLALNRMVALKFILADRNASPRHCARFRREAEVVARLRHPNIVQIYDIGEVDGRPVLALEYAEGGSLRERLAGVPLEPRAAVLLLEPLARAVQHAHRQGVIHRDLKPANILLAVGGDSVAEGNRPLPDRLPRDEYLGEAMVAAPMTACIPKLTDFGLARLFDSDLPGSESGVAAGTPSYMAPEQAGGGAVGPATDIWGLGANLYELLTGHPPFRAATAVETLRLVLTAAPIPPRQLNPKIPRDLETICLKCLQKDPAQRYASARELVQDLRSYLSGEPIHRPGQRPWWERTWQWARRRPRTAGVLTLVLGMAVLGGVTLLVLLARLGRS